MSNPLNNLRKSRKAPLPYSSLGTSSRNIPYRNAASTNYTMDESALLDEISRNLATERLQDYQRETSLPPLRDTGQGSNNTSPRANGGSTDQELMSLMTTRLTQLEQKLQYQMKENSEKDRRIRILDDKVKLLQKAREYNDPGRVHELENKCLLLQQQAHEMETFLADYGMIWVGESSQLAHRHGDDSSSRAQEEDNGEDEGILTRGDVSKLWNPETSVASDFEVDFDIIIRNIADLNSLAGEGVGKIEHRPDGARVKMPDPIQLTLYANGMMMFSGPFRPYSDEVTQACIRDLMDGYFPSELQIRYPDGIPFDVTDRRDLFFKDRLSEVFEGQGQLLGGETKPSRLVPSNLRDNLSRHSHTVDGATTQETSQMPGRQLTMQQFLQRLPSSVIKEGKIIDVRTAVGQTLTGSEGVNGVTVVETAAVKEIKHLLEDRRSASTRDLTTLRIKNERGDHTYILKMKYTDTMQDLKAYLDKQRPRSSEPYHIMSTFPKQTYSNMTLTLQQCGLVPNAMLHLQAKKHN